MPPFTCPSCGSAPVVEGTSILPSSELGLRALTRALRALEDEAAGLHVLAALDDKHGGSAGRRRAEADEASAAVRVLRTEARKAKAQLDGHTAPTP